METVTGPKPGPGTEPKSGPKSGPGTEPMSGPKPDPKSDPKSGPKSGPRSGAGAESKSGPKQDRSRATRQRLLEAAVACLAEHGWAGSTVAVVAERAGVSRGAAQHHFPTREDLFTAAVEYVAEERSQALRTLPTKDRRTVVAALVDLYTGPLFRAALHLWVAASDEEQLRPRVTELEARVGRESHRIAVELLGADESRPGVRESVQGLLDMARGLGLATLLTDDRARRERVVAQWARLLDEALG
ncbi:TetR family transcriptional regulator [Streptomyces sp. NPDC101160]|uniref:TetR/AcrR family transcriptional regulator n=1 Tax=Streptomyces sp. NPDC101160 TaxID=3366118 RepID=UPI00382C8467